MKKLLFCVVTLAMLGGCTLEHDLPPPTAGPLDSTLRAAGLSTRKVKFTGPVTLQIGGTNNTASATTVAKAKAPIAAAPAAVATEATTKSGPPVWVFVLIGGLSLAGGLAAGIYANPIIKRVLGK